MISVQTILFRWLMFFLLMFSAEQFPSSVTAFAASGSVSGAGGTSSPEPPNVLLIVGDDMGYADTGFHGCTDIPTPHLDQLAKDGVIFTDAYVSGPYCSPTRAGLMTGRYQQRFGHEFNPGVPEAGLPVSEVTLADRLRLSGYRTALIGKWHLGGRPEFHPRQRGFQHFFGFLGGAHDYFRSDSLLAGETLLSTKEDGNHLTGDYLTDRLGREACELIQKFRSGEGASANGPWFLYLAFNAVHTPMQADDVRLKKFSAITDPQRRTYAAMMSAMDDAVGQVLKTLDDTNQRRKTLIIFLSDNGGPVMKGVTVNGSRNTPLRGSKRTTLEGGIRVPFLMSWPDRIASGTYQQPVIQLDAHTTILAAAGAPIPDNGKLDGVNLLPFLNGEAQGAPHETLYWRFGNQMAIRRGRFKLVRYDRNADTLTGDRNQGVNGPFLYNLNDDIGETTDLSGKHPHEAQELQAQWDQWNSGLVEPLWER